MYTATGQGQITPGDKILMSTETSCHFGHFLQVTKIILKSDYIHFLRFYISTGQGLTTHWGQNVNRDILSLWSSVASLKKIFEI